MTDLDKDLDALFKSAQARRDHLPRDLADRMIVDAQRFQGGTAHRVVSMTPRPLWRQVIPGGWAGAGGLLAAGLAGLWIGYAPPAAFPDPAGSLVGAFGDSAGLFGEDALVLAFAEDG